MKRTVFGIAVVLVVAASTAAAAQETMTLKEAAGLLLAGSGQVQIAQEAASGAEFKIKESKSLYWPQVNVTGNYTRMSLFGEFQIPYQGQMMTIKFGTPNNYNFRASVAEQVFTWGRIGKTVDVSKAGLDLAQDGILMAKHMLSYQVVPLFYGTLFFKEAIKVLEENLKNFETKRGIMEQRYQAGLASSFDLNLIKVQISALQAQKLDFENSIRKYRISFNALTGREEQTAFEPAEHLNFEPAAFDAAALLREALSNRIEFQQIRHQVDLGQASLGLAKTGNKPTLIATFNYEFRNGFMPDIDKIKGNWTALLAVNYPAFDGHRVAAQVAQAESSLRASELKKTDQERLVTMEIQSALADIGTAEGKIEIEKVKIKQAEDALRIAEERYKNGLLSATDLIDSQNALENARLNLLQLIYNHTLSKFALYRSCGRKL